MMFSLDRFYTALALQELVNEVPINTVASKYKCSRGMLQSLQQMASTFAGIVTSFCNSLQWDTLSLIVSQFKERLFFGVHRDLIDLMRIPDLNHKRARALFDAGITSLVDLANADVLSVEKILYNALSFDSAKQHDNENALEAAQRNEARNFYITGKAGITVAEAAKLLVQEARRFVQYEIGVGNINWSQPKDNLDENTASQNGSELHMSYEENKFNGMGKQNGDIKGETKDVNIPKGEQEENNVNREDNNHKARKNVVDSKAKNPIESIGKSEISKSTEKRNSSKNENKDHKIKENLNFNARQEVKPLQEERKETQELRGQNAETPLAPTTTASKRPSVDKTETKSSNLNEFKSNKMAMQVDLKSNNSKSVDLKSKDVEILKIPEIISPGPKKLNGHRKSAEQMSAENGDDISSKLRSETKTLNEKRKSSEKMPEINTDVTPPKLRKSDGEGKNNGLDDGEKPSTSKKAQRLLRAKQLSEMKRQEWAKKREQELEQEKPDNRKESTPNKENISNKGKYNDERKLGNTLENGSETSSKTTLNIVEKIGTDKDDRRSENNKEKRDANSQKQIFNSDSLNKQKNNGTSNTIKSKEVFKTPNTISPRSSHQKPQTGTSNTKALRRSPRNQIISSTRIDYQTSSSVATPPPSKKPNKTLIKSPGELFNDDMEESFVFNTGVNEAIKQVENCQGKKDILNQSPEDEIPSSQQLCEDVNTNKTHSPHASRFLRSLRATQRAQSPMTKKGRITPEPHGRATPEPGRGFEKQVQKPEVLKNTKENQHTTTEPATKSTSPPSGGPQESGSASNIELSDFSMENSLMKNPMHLNASHILSCSKVEPDCSSFKSIDIIDICGDQQLFKGAFKEFMNNKRLGFCLGIQQQTAKRKPIIGANLLLNQVAAADRDSEKPMQNIDFQIDDTNYLAGIGFCVSENLVYYMNMQAEGTCKGLTAEVKCKYLRMLLRSQDHCLIVYDAKEQFKILRKLLKDLGEIAVSLEDPKVANWLLQPDKMHNLHSLVRLLRKKNYNSNIKVLTPFGLGPTICPRMFGIGEFVWQW